MQLLSVNVGLPRLAPWRGKMVSTGIFKEPVAGPVGVRRLNLDGDRQADLTVHGGPEKAVYVYPAEYYDYWRADEAFAGEPLPWGQFGENFTTTGLRDDEVQIGDRFRIGTAEFIVTQPRLPCYKLAIRFDRPDMLRRFLASGRMGFYLSVAQEGTVTAGDAIVPLDHATHDITPAMIGRLAFDTDADAGELARAIAVESLPEAWRDDFRRRLAERG